MSTEPTITPPSGIAGLKTPEPAKTPEQAIASGVTGLVGLLVLFKLNVTDAEQAWIIGALGTLYSGFTLWHAKGVRAARAIAKGLGVSGASPSVKP